MEAPAGVGEDLSGGQVHEDGVDVAVDVLRGISGNSLEQAAEVKRNQEVTGVDVIEGEDRGAGGEHGRGEWEVAERFERDAEVRRTGSQKGDGRESEQQENGETRRRGGDGGDGTRWKGLETAWRSGLERSGTGLRKTGTFETGPYCFMDARGKLPDSRGRDLKFDGAYGFRRGCYKELGTEFPGGRGSMSEGRGWVRSLGRRVRCGAVLLGVIGMPAGGVCQGASAPAKAPEQVYKPVPAFDLSSIDASADPCTDFYKFACGRFAANHPIPPDQPEESGLYSLVNVNTQELRAILEKAESGGAGRSPNEQKIGDYYKSCMDTEAIERKGLTPLEPMLGRSTAWGMECWRNGICCR